MAAVRAALGNAKRVVVIEKSLAVGLGGIVSSNVYNSYTGHADAVHAVIAGLGGRSITRASLARLLGDAVKGRLEPLTFLDLDQPLVERALAREREQRRSGPIAENILRDLGVVAARPG
jgi:pyruvate ferredoxin oxidoreductase alpha subunit